MAEEKEDDKAAAGWWGIVLRRGWQVGKRVAVAGAAITAAPVVAPPLLLLSTLGLALAFPFTLYLASFACADKLMSSLLPLPQEPMQQEAYSEQGDEDEDGDDEIPRSYPSMAAANDESRQNTEIFVEEEETLSNKDGDEGDLNEEDGTIHQLAENQEFSEQSSGPPLSAGDGEIEIKEDEKGESGEGEEEEEKGGEAGQLGGNAVLQTDINGRSEEKQSGVMRDGDGGGLDEEKKEEDSVDAAVVTESERATKIMSEKRPIERDLGKREEVGENDDAGKHDGEMPPSEIEIEIEPSGLSSEYASAVEDSSPDVAEGGSRISTGRGLDAKPAGSAVVVAENEPARPSKDEGLYSEEKIWEQLYAMRTIVGYKAAHQPSYLEELKALYLFTGVEPPVSSKNPSDLKEVYNELQFLKSVIGVR